MWDMSSPARDRTSAPCNRSASLSHWTAKEVPQPPVLSTAVRFVNREDVEMKRKGREAEDN